MNGEQNMFLKIKQPKGQTMKKMLFVIAISLFIGACSRNGYNPKPIDYISPCACYELIKITKFKG